MHLFCYSLTTLLNPILNSLYLFSVLVLKLTYLAFNYLKLLTKCYSTCNYFVSVSVPKIMIKFY